MRISNQNITSSRKEEEKLGRVVDKWNGLSDQVVCAKTIQSFKRDQRNIWMGMIGGNR